MIAGLTPAPLDSRDTVLELQCARRYIEMRLLMEKQFMFCRVCERLASLNGIEQHFFDKNGLTPAGRNVV